MDNLTHTLIGLAAGEAAARCMRARAGALPVPVRRTALLAVGMVGGNLPDVDLLWSMQVFTSDRLAYLVQHRGYTHTLLGCMTLALLLFAGTLAILRWRGHRVRAPDARLLGAASLLAVMLHLGMDALNEYGVHPFWPWNNRWYYGDSVFIVEPLCWLATAPLFFVFRTRIARIFLGAVLAVGCIAVLAFHRFGIPWWGLPLGTVLLLFAGRRLSPRAASLAAVVLLCAVVGGFSAAHAAVLQRVQFIALTQFPGARTLDIVLSPAPAHPFCWDVVLLQQAGSDYMARIGQLSLLKQSGEACSRSVTTGATASFVPMQVPVVSGMRWSGVYSMNVLALARLASSNCDTRRLASFLRAPFATKTEAGWIIGDLRFDRETGPGFAEALVDPHAPASCARGSPWTPPRTDLGFR